MATGTTVVVRRELDPVAAQWEQLAERVGAPPFVRVGWFEAWARAFGLNDLRLHCLHRGNALEAVLALVQRRAGALTSVTNWHTPLFGAVVGDQAAAGELARGLLAERPPRLDLRFVDLADPLASELRAHAAADRLPVAERVILTSPYIAVAGDWADFEAGLPGKRRADLRRRRRRLDERGAVRFESSDGSERLGQLLNEGFAVEASGWKGERRSAIVSRPETVRFYEEVARWAAERGWLRLWFLRLDDRPLAFAYCLLHEGAYYVVKIGFDPEFARFAPGSLLTREMLAHAFESGVRSYEFLGQADPYKLEWTGDCHQRSQLQVFARTPAGTASRLLWKRGLPLARSLRARLRDAPSPAPPRLERLDDSRAAPRRAAPSSILTVTLGVGSQS